MNSPGTEFGTEMSPGKARAKFFAKLSLWLPFIGLAIYLAFAFTMGDHPGRQPRSVSWAIMTIVCCYIWACGIALGFMALHRTKTEGRKGAFGRAIVGIVVSSLFLGLTVWGAIWIVWSDANLARLREKAAKREAEVASAGVGDKAASQKELVARANSAFGARLQELTNNYHSSWAALTNPAVIDMTGVRSRDDLVAREQKIREFIKAAEDARDFYETVTNHYSELLNHELSTEVREEAVKRFAESQQGVHGLAVTLREADVRRGYKLLDVVAFLDTNWGKWTLNSQTRRLVFRDTRLAEDYNRTLKEWKGATAEVLKLQQQYKAELKEKRSDRDQ